MSDVYILPMWNTRFQHFSVIWKCISRALDVQILNIWKLYCIDITLKNCGSNQLLLSFNNSTEIEIIDGDFDQFRVEGEQYIYSDSIETWDNFALISFPKNTDLENKFLSFLSEERSGSPRILVNKRPIPQFFSVPILFPDNDQDGYPCNEDCDDNNSSIHPLAPDNLVNGFDENCDGIDGPEMKNMSNFNIYPNPTSDGVFELIIFGTEKVKLRIDHVKGLNITSSTLLPGKHIVNLGSYKKGTYLVTLTPVSGEKTFKKVIYRWINQS